MSYRYAILKDRPVGVWPLTSSGTFTDYSGYSAIGRIKSGYDNNGQTTPVTSNHAAAATLDADAVAEFFPGVYIQHREQEAFSLECWAIPILPAAGPVAILSKPGQYDGLTIDNDTIVFTTRYTSAPAAVCSYTLDIFQKCHIVATHTYEQNKLYVNGDLVAQVYLTDAQRADTFASSDTSLVCGETATDVTIAVNAVAAYHYALNDTQVADHHSLGNLVVKPNSEVYASFGGYAIPVDRSAAHIFLDQTWDSAGDFADGQFENVGITSDALTPYVDEDGDVVPGDWITSFPLDYGETDTIYSVMIEWDGDAIVQTSLDKTVWSTATNRATVPGISYPFTPTDKTLFVRIAFGVFNDATDAITRLRLVGFTDGDFDTLQARTLNVTADARVYDDDDVFDFADNRGIETMHASSTVTIGGTEPVYAAMFWAKRKAHTFGLSPSADITYKNGSTLSTGMNQGEWSLRQVVWNSGVTGDITITTDTKLIDTVLFATIPTTTQMVQMFQAYTGRTVGTAQTSTTSMAVTSGSAKVIACDWSITGAGG